jgi:signal transduction histidine kinase
MTDLLASVEPVVCQHEPLLLRRKQRVNVKIAPDLRVWADPVALGHAFTNLLINAHRHSIEGDTFTISARRLSDLGLVEVRVRDHGPGVSVQDRRRIFDRFYRGTGAQNHRGAGLGLAIVKSLVEGHGGTVGVSAARGGGAVFWIRLPASPQEQPGHLQQASKTNLYGLPLGY